MRDRVATSWTGGKSWAPAWCVVAGYIGIGVALVTGPMPEGFAPSGGILPGVDSMARVGWDAGRIYWFWYGMLAVFPVALALLGVFAPVVLKHGTRNDAATRKALLYGLLLFGFMVLPGLVYFVLFDPDVVHHHGRRWRAVAGMSREPFTLVVIGCQIMVTMLLMAWLVFVAIPRSYLKIKGLPTSAFDR
jgi:hypothetical protein